MRGSPCSILFEPVVVVGLLRGKDAGLVRLIPCAEIFFPVCRSFEIGSPFHPRYWSRILASSQRSEAISCDSAFA